jgi:hypothetical protein
MANNKKISELTQTNVVTGEELIPFALDGQNKVVKAKFLKGADNLGEDFVDLVGDDGQEYRVKIVNGVPVAMRMDVFNAEDAKDEGLNPTVYTGLIINQMYGAGDAIEGTPVSHGFIELYNFTNKEMNLKGIHLFYRAKAGSWQSLPLQGILPARHSFLIRCAQHTIPFSQGVRHNIVDYDMHWDIRLSDKGFSCYLQIGNEIPEDNPVRQHKDAEGNVTYTNGKYIDLLGAGGVNKEDSVWAYETRYLNCMDKNTGVRRVDFANSDAKQVKAMGLGNNAAVSGLNDCDVEPIDYKTCNMEFYRPRCMKDGRWTETVDKPKQKDTLPSMINVMFGEDGEHTRTFTFQTPLVENGFVKIRKDGETKWHNFETNTEMFSNLDGDVSVHRCIVRDLEPGLYEYQVGTEGCVSDNYSFEIKEFNEENGMRILWTTDQQSWSKREYDVWQMCARFLNNKQQNLDVPFDFHLNTGDISQNANRKFEWSYYFDYAKDITRNIPHVITCGNNDLIDKKYSDAFNYYLTAENQKWNSVYAFDLGFVHFVCLNSNEDQTFGGPGKEFVDTNAFLEAQAQWLDEHLTEVEAREVQPRWVIVFAHLSPLTVGRTKRLQRWIAPIEKHKVDMFLCGHNHAWSVSKPVYSGFDFNASPAYNDYVTTQSGTTDLKIVDEFQADGVTEINREADPANGTYYVLNQAAGFKLSGKEKPLNLTGKVEEKHINEDGSPWWIESQALPTNPVYIDLKIDFDQIVCDSYEITGIKGADEFKNAVINHDLDKVGETKFHTLTINHSDRNK